MAQIAESTQQLLTYQCILDPTLAKENAKWMSDCLKEIDTKQSHTPADLKRVMCESLDRKKVDFSSASIPLSVGCDSRFIYACAREFVEADKIDAVTFGQPGNYEYEFSRFLYKKTIPQHRRLDFSGYHWDSSRIVELLKKNGSAVVWHWPPCIAELNGPILHGFLGDPLAASRVPNEASQSVDSALKHFHRKSCTSLSVSLEIGQSLKGVEPCFDGIFDSLNSGDLDLIVDYSLRQDQRIRPKFVENSVGAVYPFLDADVIKLMWSVDPRLKRDEQWYMTSLVELFPDLFWDLRFARISSKSRYKRYISVAKVWGRIRSVFGFPRSVTSMYNWGQEILSNPNLYFMVKEQLSDLSGRQLSHPFDLPEMLKHLHDKAAKYIISHHQHYQFAAYLELNAKAGFITDQ